MLNASQISSLHDGLTLRWHTDAFETWVRPENELVNLISSQHLANYQLWHTEDAARRPGAADAEIARVKHQIDEVNQTRNDLSEKIDRTLLESLSSKGLPKAGAVLHSESPGLIVDRLSILALKIFHTQEEILRPNASEAHVKRNQLRLAVLLEQRSDLAGCLDHLWQETLAGTRRFKLYQQLKMYNDPELNPAVYERPERAVRR